MAERYDRRNSLIQAIRWTCRALAAISVGLILAFLVGEGFRPSQVDAGDWLGLLFFPAGICCGMVLAWWREGLGGIITVGSLLMFYVVHYATSGTFPKGWAWLAFSAPGVLFLLSWRLSRNKRTKKT
jgi:hypothetical protein